MYMHESKSNQKSDIHIKNNKIKNWKLFTKKVLFSKLNSFVGKLSFMSIFL